MHKALVDMETALHRDECIEVKVAALGALVDMMDVLPESVRRSRVLPLFRQLCTQYSSPSVPAAT